MSRVSTHRRWAQEGKKPKSPPMEGLAFLASTTLARFAADRRGTIALPFAFMVTVMLLLTGAAVDIGMWMQARNDTIEAMDAAVLAGLKKYQDTNSTSQAIAAAQLSYTANVAKRITVLSDTVNFQMINNNTEMQATGGAYMQTNFLKLAGIAKLPLVKTDGSENSISLASVGSNAGQSLEVAIMIDNTGSMCESAATANTGNCDTPSKIQTVIDAANSLVDTVIWSDQSQFTSKISLIPFSEAVNLGTASIANAARGTLKTTGGDASIISGQRCGWRGCTGGTTTMVPNADNDLGWQGYQIASYDDWGQSAGNQVFWASSTCVTERTGTHKYDDASPVTYPVGALYNEPVTFANQWNWNYTSNTMTTYTDWCPIAATLMPLTTDKTALHNAINAMTPNGGTAGHIGTAWAWYTLSPNFNSLWPSTANAARPYSDLQTLNAHGQPILKKIAILMTDGAYNYEYTNGVSDWYSNTSPTNDTSLNQAKALCTNMKAQGIEVYTIGAMVSSSSASFLQSCATDASHFYNASDTVSLTAAFKSITQKLVQLHLTH